MRLSGLYLLLCAMAKSTKPLGTAGGGEAGAPRPDERVGHKLEGYNRAVCQRNNRAKWVLLTSVDVCAGSPELGVLNLLANDSNGVDGGC
jgi:hypothetical protein